MDFLKTQTTPNKITKSGNYPILDSQDILSCTIESLIRTPEQYDSSISIIGETELLIPPSEDDIPAGYVCDIYEPIQGKTGSNWSQETMYEAYNNPQYWGTEQSVNEWIRSGETLTFNIYEIISGNKTLVNSQSFNVYNLLYESGRFKSGCTNINIFNIEGGNITFYQDVELPANGFGAKGKVPAGFYDLVNAPGNPSESLAPGSIVVDTFKAQGPISGFLSTWRIVLGNLQAGLPSTGPCTLSRQLYFFAWVNTGVYGSGKYRLTNWNICDNPNTFVPLCANCD